MDLILQYASYVMLGILGVFVLFGMLFGMGRGLKRSTLRLLIFVGSLVAVFLLTPVVGSAILGIDVTICGKTPNQWVDGLSDQLVVFLQESMSSYVAPFGPYIKEYATSIVLAVVNMVLFVLLYIIIKMISWFVYAIVARFAAPKKDRNGNKVKQYRLAGLLVGALQGVLLFAFFFLPVNGVLGVVNQAAQYQTAQASDDVGTASASVNEDSGSSEFDLETILTKVDSSLTLYNNVLRYSGLQFLSNKAFEYQLTLRVDGGDSINLVHDINSAWELYVDSNALTKVIEKFSNIADTHDLTVLTTNDYKVLRQYVNKTFDLQILHIADAVLTDLDKIFNTPFGEDQTKIEGTDVYADSFYGMIVKSNVTNREFASDVNVNNEYVQGIRAVVNYISNQKLNLVRNDVLAAIDLMESLGTYKISFGDETTTFTAALAQPNLNWVDYLQLVTAGLSEKQGDYAAETPIMNVLGNRLQQFSLIKMLSLSKVDNLVVYGNLLDNTLDEQPKVGTLVTDLSQLFLGDKAFTKGEQKGNWEKLGGLVLNVAVMVRDNQDVIDKIVALINENQQLDTQKIIEVVGDLTISETYFNEHRAEFTATEYNDEVKYQKVSQVVDVLYDTVNAFAPVKTFVVDYLTEMSESGNELVNSLVEMLNGDKAKWLSTIRGMVSAANLVNTPVVKDFMDKMQDPEATLDNKDLAQLLNTATTELKAEDVSELVETVVNLPEIGDMVKDALNSVLETVNQPEADWSEIFGNDAETVETVKASFDTLQDYFGTEGESTVTNEEMKAAVETLWNTVKESEALKNYIDSLSESVAA